MAEFEKIDVIKLSTSYLTSDEDKKRVQLTVDTETTPSEANSESGEREQWTSGLDFFLASLGYAVGVGNVWRFPYLCYKNGGGTFLVPYFTFMFVIGIPMIFLEFSVGQFTSKGPLLSWKMIRICQGIGISVNIANSLLILFYNMIIAYSLYFVVLSFTTELPWQKCRDYSSPNCVDNYDPTVFKYNVCNDQNLFKCDELESINFGRCFNNTLTQATACSQFETNSSIAYWKTSFPSADYWNKMVLQKSSGIDDSGTLIWQLVIALFCSYLLVFIMLVGGKKISGKIVWFTSLFPYVVLLILGIRGWLLPGADIGIKFYLTPDWSKLSNVTVWADAATQIFFTLSIGYGGMSTLSSYNRFNHNCLRDAFFIPLANCLTSFFAGFVIFSYMGYLSNVTGQDIDKIIQAGQGLAYVVYPHAVTTIPGAPFWAICFFIMIILLGIDSALGSMEVTIACVMDAFPHLESTKRKKFFSFVAIFSIYFSCSLIFCLNSGTYWIEFFNTNAGGWAILLIGATECITVAYLYGVSNIRRDINSMLGDKYTGCSFYIWYLMWLVVTPTLLILITVITITQVSRQQVGDYLFPEWTLILGQMMTVSLLLGILCWPIYAIIDAKYYKKRSFKSLFTPDFEAFMPVKECDRLTVDISRNLKYEKPMKYVDNFAFEYCDDKIVKF